MSDVYREYQPHIGSNLGPDPEAFEASVNSYADLPSLLNDLAEIVRTSTSVQSELESRLSRYAIEIDATDTRMVQAHKDLWPKNLGIPSEQIGYQYYKSFNNSGSTSAEYLKEKFTDAARDVKGTADLDLLEITTIAKKEAMLMQKFITEHIKNVNDSAELRTLELFQDWARSAKTKINKLIQHAQSSQQKVLDPEKIDSIPEDEARQGQAVFKIKLNELNEKIESELAELHYIFSDHSEIFYDRFLGPAIDFRLGAQHKTARSPSPLNAELFESFNDFEQHLRSSLADQLKRVRFFHRKVDQIIGDIEQRDRYRTLIKELATKGKPLPNHGPKVMVEAIDKEEELLYWHQVQSSEFKEVFAGSLSASHKNIDDLEEGDPHPQYLLRSGGTITGHIAMDDNITIGGIVPSTHAHTGEDGSTQIHASSIIPGTLRTGVVDESEVPPVPYDLQLQGTNSMLFPSGKTAVDGYISWRGEKRFDYETQIVRIPISSEHIKFTGVLWVLSQEGGGYRIYQVSVETGVVVGYIDVPEFILEPRGLHFYQNHLWVTSNGGNSIHQLNPANGSEVSSLSLSFSPIGLTYADDHWWITDGEQVHKVDPVSGLTIESIEVPEGVSL